MSNNTKNKRISVFSILIFVLCGLLTIYTVGAIISVTSYMKEMLSYGQVSLSENFFDVMSYYMTNCGNYIIFIAILLSIWWVSNKKMVERKAKDIAKPELTAKDDITPEEDAEKADTKDDKKAEDKKDDKEEK